MRRARQFAKLIREITVSAKIGLPDPAANPRLRSAVLAARKENMPKDTIDRAIKKAAGAAAGEDYVEVRYEGYGRAGVAVIVEALTDKNDRGRPAVGVRQEGGAWAKPIPYLFCSPDSGGGLPDEGSARMLLEAAIETGADDVESGAGGARGDDVGRGFFAVRDALTAIRRGGGRSSSGGRRPR